MRFVHWLRLFRQQCARDAEGSGYLEHSMKMMNFSARAHDQILEVAITLANRSGSPNIRTNDVRQAIKDHSLDRKLFT